MSFRGLTWKANLVTDLALRDRDQRELATLTGIVEDRGGYVAETIIHIHMGPLQNPQRVRIRRSAWPTRTTLNSVDFGREFHMRLRQHEGTGVYLVYGSVTRPDGSIVQRGHLCRTLDDVKRVLPLLKKELGIESPGKLEP